MKKDGILSLLNALPLDMQLDAERGLSLTPFVELVEMPSSLQKCMFLGEIGCLSFTIFHGIL